MNKVKLLEIREIIAQTLKELESTPANNSFKPFTPAPLGNYQSGWRQAQVGYANPLTALISRTGYSEKVQWEQRLRTAEITRPAKALAKQFDDEGIFIFADFRDAVLDKTKNASDGQLTPHESLLKVAIREGFQDAELKVDALYNSFVLDVFNQGRQHSDNANKLLVANMKKYAKFARNDNEQYQAINEHIKSQQKDFLGVMRAELNFEAIDLIKSKADLDTFLTNFENKITSYNLRQVAMLRKHFWQAYCYGNLYQLEKDGVEYVGWKSGHKDDCLECRAYDTGDAVLYDVDGQALPHIRNIDNVKYSLAQVKAALGFDAPNKFTHETCRCTFVPRK